MKLSRIFSKEELERREEVFEKMKLEGELFCIETVRGEKNR